MKPAAVVKTLRNGAMAVNVRHYADGRFGFDFKPAGEDRKKIRCKSVEDAISRGQQFAGASHAGKLDLLGIDPREFREFLAWKANALPKIMVPEIAGRFVQSRLEKGRSHARIREIKGVLEPFAAAFQMPIGDVTREAVEAWINARKVGPRRWNNIREVICSLFKFARRCGHLGAALTPVELIEPKKVSVSIQTYSPAELERILTAVPHEWRPLLIMGAFCGIRPEEICPDVRGGKPALQWENVLWSKRKVDVPAAVSKVGRRRFVPLCTAALAFLAPWRRAVGPCVPRSTLYKRTSRWAASAGVGWKPDGLRHSYASYRLAIIKNIQELALEMGNSPRMIHAHYLDLKHDSEARAWFAMRPVTPKNVIQMNGTEVPKTARK